ncbi:MAG: hypothetical protein SNJ78_02370 [Spirochaetales bacterium]
MFENVLHQDQVTQQLSKEVQTQSLPPSILFAGPPYAGKLSAALELARVLSCERKEGEWNCSCKSCEMHRQLLAPNTLLLGGRYFNTEVAACADTLLRTKSISGRYLFIRSLRKLTRRFDPVLWEGEEVRLQKVTPLLTRLEEIAYDLGPDQGEMPPKEKLEKVLQEAITLVGKVEDSFSLGTVPVGVVRKVSSWAHLRGTETKKIVILEHTDRLLDASRNALLKLLEEPPSSVYFILLTTRRSAIIPTILSRVRSYLFKQRTGKEAIEVLERVFKLPSGETYPDLSTFFLLFQGLKPNLLYQAAVQFILAASNSEAPFPEALAVELFQDREKFRLFLEQVLVVLHHFLTQESVGVVDGKPSLTQMEEWAKLIQKAVESVEVLNVHPLLAAERLFHRMRRRYA